MSRKNMDTDSINYRPGAESVVDQLGETAERRLDVLFKKRFHGAVNIRGIRYQLLYTLLRAFDLYDQVTSLTFEGIEGPGPQRLHIRVDFRPSQVRRESLELGEA